MFLLAVAWGVLVIAGAVLVGTLIATVREFRQTAHQCAETSCRLTVQVEALCGETRHIRSNADALVETAGTWRRVTALPAEISHLNRSVRLLSQTIVVVAAWQRSWRQSGRVEVRKLLHNFFQGG